MNKKEVIGKLEEELNKKERKFEKRKKKIIMMKHTCKSSDDDDEGHDMSDVLIADGGTDTKLKKRTCSANSASTSEKNTLKKHINTKPVVENVTQCKKTYRKLNDTSGYIEESTVL